LRFYCYEHRDGKVYLFFNEHPHKAIDGQVTILNGTYRSMEEYDAMQNKVDTYVIKHNRFQLSLEPGEMKILIPKEQSDGAVNRLVRTKVQPVCCDWTVSLQEAGTAQGFEEKLVLKAGDSLPNMNGKGYFSDFSGTYRYEGGFHLEEKSIGSCMLYLPRFGDCAQIYVNNRAVGMLLASPGRLDISEWIRPGENQLTIEITNTLVWKVRDGASTHLQVEPTGMTMQPVLEFYQA